MSHPIVNKIKQFDIEFLRRIGIGIGFGIVAVLLLSLFTGNTVNYKDIVFDSEKIEIVGTQKEKHIEVNQDVKTDNNNDLFQKNAKYFPSFSKHKTPLNETQLDAINHNEKRFSLIISNIGQSSKIVAKILETLPPSVTIGMSAYTKNHNEVVTQFDQYGFETWMEMASITLDETADRGDLALNPTRDFDQNIKNITTQLSNKDKLTGLILPIESIITETPALWKDLVFDLFAQGFGIFDNTVNIMSPSLYFHETHKAPYIKGDISLDKNISNRDLKFALKSFEKKINEEKNITISITSPTPATIDILSDWLHSLEEKNIVTIPLSAQANL